MGGPLLHAAPKSFKLPFGRGTVYTPTIGKEPFNIAARKISNPIVLGGDLHNAIVADLKVDFDDAKSPVIATEFVGTSITSRQPVLGLVLGRLPATLELSVMALVIAAFIGGIVTSASLLANGPSFNLAAREALARAPAQSPSDAAASAAREREAYAALRAATTTSAFRLAQVRQLIVRKILFSRFDALVRGARVSDAFARLFSGQRLEEFKLAQAESAARFALRHNGQEPADRLLGATRALAAAITALVAERAERPRGLRAYAFRAVLQRADEAVNRATIADRAELVVAGLVVPLKPAPGSA